MYFATIKPFFIFVNIIFIHYIKILAAYYIPLLILICLYIHEQLDHTWFIHLRENGNDVIKSLRVFCWWNHTDVRSFALMINVLSPISLIIFTSQFRFDENLFLLLTQFWQSIHYKILYMAQQLCCHGLCKHMWQLQQNKLFIEFGVWVKKN